MVIGVKANDRGDPSTSYGYANIEFTFYTSDSGMQPPVWNNLPPKPIKVDENVDRDTVVTTLNAASDLADNIFYSQPKGTVALHI